MHSFHHALSSVARFGGIAEDYLPIHNWFDDTKKSMANFRHRAAKHHSEGIFWCEERFGVTIKNSSGRIIPTRLIGEQHVKEDLGFIPNLTDWLKEIQGKKWMSMSNVVKSANTEKLFNGEPVKLDQKAMIL